MLYQSKLIPRWLSGWGIIGATLLLAMGLLRMFARSATARERAVFLAIPLILNELVLVAWLIVKGYNSFTIAFTIVGVLFITALEARAILWLALARAMLQKHRVLIMRAPFVVFFSKYTRC